MYNARQSTPARVLNITYLLRSNVASVGGGKIYADLDIGSFTTWNIKPELTATDEKDGGCTFYQNALRSKIVSKSKSTSIQG